FLAYNLAFHEFNRVLRNEAVASEVSLAEVAIMVNSPEGDLIAIANGDAPGETPSKPMEGEPVRPDWVDQVDLAAARTIDTRPIFDNGMEPLETILKELGEAGPDEVIVVEAPFCPAPLRRLFAKRGYESSAEELAPNHWRCIFRPT
ncbi:MAG: DUF2249 domain-containing protein, partial [Alphaproteobacteria bacterium]|nr:DUF2249 domain-containing protein [Alphaproteobacteria bacterium]